MKNFNYKFLLISLFIAIFGISCQLGLGEAVDLEAPTVEITRPTFMASVGDNFSVEGTAYDKNGVTRFILEFNNNKWKYENAEWKYQANGSSDWVTPQSNVCTWRQSEDNHCSWSITNLSITESGEYVITANAYDLAENTSKNSVASRTVVYDKSAPKVSVTSIAKMYDTQADIESDLDLKTNPQEFAMLKTYVNGSFELAGIMDENYTPKSLEIFIKKDDTIIWKSPRYVSSGEYITSQTDRVSGFLRGWSVQVPDLSKAENTLNGTALTGKNYLEIVTTAYDTAGNAEREKSQGFFCYWPQADIPWTNITLSPNTSGDILEYYPNSKIQGYSYDDDGIGIIHVTLYKNSSKTGEYSEKLWEKNLYTYDPETDEKTMYRSWSLPVPNEAIYYKAEITTKDVNGTSGADYIGYFKVQDADFPEIVMVSAPAQNKPMFGDKDKSGNITFSINAMDDNSINEIKYVYIKNESDAANYLIPGSDKWTGSAAKNLPVTDTNNKDAHNRKIYSTDLTLNIFTDLEIDGSTNKLTGQHFIFFASDKDGNKTVLDYTIQGDNEPPKITIDKITINSTPYTVSDYNNKSNMSLPAFKSGDTVTFSGKWSDDSTDAWTDKTKISGITLNWGSTPITVTRNDDGTWTSAEIAYISGSVISLTASITDYAGNTGSAKANMNVVTDLPELKNITSETPDGTYGVGTEIVIVLKFNKNITVSGTPTMTLDVGTATAKSADFDTTTDNSQNLKFKYTVQAGDSIDAVKVKSVSLTGSDGVNSITVSYDDSTTTIPSDYDISKKKIKIVTSSPTVSSVEWQTGSSEKKVDITFSTAVIKGSGSITFEQQNVTAIPVVITSAEYDSLPATVKTYYEEGTNGSDENGKADTKTKYILKYEYDSSNNYKYTDADNNVHDALQAYKDANCHKVIVDVNSSAVTLNSDGTVMTVDLTGTPLPCLGAEYKVTVPADMVYNEVNNRNTLSNDKTLTLSGIEPPAIRIKKSKATITNATTTVKDKDKKNITINASTQPFTSEFKIDCETPGTTIKYQIATSTAEKVSITEPQSSYTAKNFTPETPSFVDKGEYKNTDPHPIGTDGNYKQGERHIIMATASKTGSADVTVYESAYRTTIVCAGIQTIFTNSHNSLLTQLGVSNAYEVGAWLRGGDDIGGTNTTAGFPLSWVVKDLSGVALMTRAQTKNASGDIITDDWYYISWEINTTCYCAPLAGSIDAESKNGKGPAKYIYAQNNWMTTKEFVYIMPGGYLELKCNDTIAFHATDAGKVKDRE